ncbi:izumo sperm-egg fusion protein 3 [Eleutherodactylus coqui]|uniref:izumo sperm-egg fusion protein 3 n=1 Tax=Eleutherodactylus coqui TaxID=57060 RepID=UPI00346287CB
MSGFPTAEAKAKLCTKEQRVDCSEDGRETPSGGIFKRDLQVRGSGELQERKNEQGEAGCGEEFGEKVRELRQEVKEELEGVIIRGGSPKYLKAPPDRQDLLERVKKDILGVYQSSFRDKANLRIIDIRSVAKLRKTVLDNLKKVEFHGVKTFLTDITRLKQELTQQMRQSLHDFADLACSEDCAVTEGPVLDSWTCFRIRAQCFKGSVCGGVTFIIR